MSEEGGLTSLNGSAEKWPRGLGGKDKTIGTIRVQQGVSKVETGLIGWDWRSGHEDGLTAVKPKYRGDRAHSGWKGGQGIEELGTWFDGRGAWEGGGEEQIHEQWRGGGGDVWIAARDGDWIGGWEGRRP